MRKLVLALALLATVCFESCNYCTRKYGGSTVIRLEPGEKLVEVTWKDANLWYLVEPMEDGYTPKTKVFKEDSNIGMLEGTVTFIETK
jgi:hypothetical protein